MLFVEDGQIVIVDYKTDRVEAHGVDAATEEHRAQLAVYAAGAQQASGLKVRETVVVFASAAAERTVVVDDGMLDRGAALMSTGSL